MPDSVNLYRTQRWRKARANLLNTQPHICARCGSPIPADQPKVAGHVVDRALGGDMTQLQVECLACSRKSGGELRARLAHAAAHQGDGVNDVAAQQNPRGRRRYRSREARERNANRVAAQQDSLDEDATATTDSEQGTFLVGGIAGRGPVAQSSLPQVSPNSPVGVGDSRAGFPTPATVFGTPIPRPAADQNSANSVGTQQDSLIDEQVTQEWESSPGDGRWQGAGWLREFLTVPTDSTWPRLMTAPHPRAVGTYGPEFASWCRDVRRIELRWWQRLVASRMLEHDAAGHLVWLVVLLSTSRQVGKSVLLSLMCQWRITQAERFGGEQLVVNIGKDLAVVREVQRSARAWARAHRDFGWNALDANGKEEVSAPDGSRWVLRGKDSTYGYAATMPVVDEAWDVRAAVVDDGLEPTMLEREQSQMLLVSTAHRRATSLFPARRAGAIDQLQSPDDVLLVEWSAHADADLDDQDAWRAASPQWSARRQKLLASKLARALSGESDADDPEEDALESFRAQYLNAWTPPAARLRGRDEPLVAAAVWDACGSLIAHPAPGPAVVALEDYFGLGAGVAVAAWDADEPERALVWGALFASRAQALEWAAAAGTAPGREGSQLLVGASLATWAASALAPDVALTVEPVALANTRAALPAVRDLVARGALVHDCGLALAEQATQALVVKGSAGLSISSRSPRTDLLRAAAWALQRLTTQGAAQPFRIM